MYTLRLNPSRCLFFVISNTVLTRITFFVDRLYRILTNITGRASHICDHHTNLSVRYIKIRTITVWSIAPILIGITYFSFFEIYNSKQYRVIVGFSPTPGWQVSAISCRYYTIQSLPWRLPFVNIPTLQGEHHIFVITLQTCQCAISKLGQLRFDLLHQYL